MYGETAAQFMQMGRAVTNSLFIIFAMIDIEASKGLAKIAADADPVIGAHLRQLQKESFGAFRIPQSLTDTEQVIEV